MYPLGALFDIVPAIIPFDLQTARDGDWVSLRGYQGCAVVVFKGVGTDNDDVIVRFEQATSVAAGGAKTLPCIRTIWEKEAVALTGNTGWTKVTQAAGASYTPGDPSAQSQELWVFQINNDELDVDGGFDCIRVRIDDVGNGGAQLGCALYILYNPRYATEPDHLVNSIID